MFIATPESKVYAVVKIMVSNRACDVESPSKPFPIKALHFLVLVVLPATYWASEASPTLGCSIEISRDICIYIYVGMSRMSN